MTSPDPAPERPTPTVVVYEVRERDTLESIAAAHGIDDWVDLLEHNERALREAGYLQASAGRTIDELRPPLSLEIPVDRSHALARELLERRGVKLDDYLVGTHWLDPRGQVSLTVRGDDGALLADGTAVELLDERGVVVDEATVEAGRVWARLARRAWRVRVKAHEAFDERYADHRQEARESRARRSAAPPDPRLAQLAGHLPSLLPVGARPLVPPAFAPAAPAAGDAPAAPARAGTRRRGLVLGGARGASS